MGLAIWPMRSFPQGTSAFFYMITIESQLKVYLVRFHTFVRNDIDLVALSGTCSSTWVSSRTHVRDLFFELNFGGTHFFYCDTQQQMTID